MKLRKLFALMMTLVMLISMMPAAQAQAIWCPDLGLDHSWGPSEYWNGTCEWGMHYCTVCGAGGEVPPQHNWTTQITLQPGCDTTGYKEIICADCHSEQGNPEEIPALGHDWGSWGWAHGSAPSCTEGAWQVRTCKRCGRIEDKWVEAGNHQWGSWNTVSAGNCQTPAKERRTCSICGATENRDGSYGSHSWGNWSTVSSGTCNTPAKEQRSCSICGATERRDGNYGNHNWGEWYRASVPTCTAEGLMRRNCSICGKVETDPIPMVDHNFGEWYVVTEAQVGLPGLEQRDCTYGCGTFEQREIPALEAESAAGLDLTLVLSSTPANGTHFVVGEEVIFTETWSNGTDKTLYPFSVSIWTCGTPVFGSEIDQICSWFAEDGGGPVAPGASGSHTLTVTVTEADVDRGAIYATAEILSTVHNGPDLENVTTPFVTAPCRAGEVDLDGLTVTKSASAGDHSNPCKPGDEVTFTITVTNNTGVELRDVEITDPIKGNNEDAVLDRIPSMQPGESVTASFSYTVTEEDATVGIEGFENTAYASGHTADGTKVSGASETIFVWCVIPHELDFSKSVVNTPANGEFFVPGETIEFAIHMTNDTPYPLYTITLTDPLCQDQYIYDAINDMSYLYFGELYREDNAAMGHSSSATVNVKYVVTEADAEAGAVTNTAMVHYQTWYGKELSASASATAKCGKGDMSLSDELTISKTVSGTPANGEFYVPGETICFIISMTNDTPHPLYNVVLTDPLCEDQYFHDEVNGMSYLYMDNFDSGDDPQGYSSAQVAPTYVVTEADAEAGFVTNTAIVNYQTWNGEEKTASASVTVKCGKASDAVVLEKIDMRSPANGEYYVPGEVIKYGLTVRSTEDNPLQNIIIYDPLKGGDQVVFGPADSWVLGAGFDYTVTEADAQRGYIENTGYATFTYQNTGEDGTVYSNTLTLPCGFVKDAGLSSALSLTKSVTSTPANGSYYVPGETVTYELYVKNNGEPLDNLDVSDWMWEDERAWIGTFAAGEDVTYPVTHIVTDADARAKHVNNIACATAIDKEGNQITEYSNLVTVPCGFPEGDDPFGIFHSVAVIKAEESLPLNGQYYTEGEVIHYTITYTNDGELPLTDVEVWDILDVSTPIAHAETLQPGESRVCYYQHTVTAADVAAGAVMNIAHASYPVSSSAGFANSCSNVVISKTSANDFVWGTLPIFPDGTIIGSTATPGGTTTPGGYTPGGYTPGTGWFPGGEPTPEGEDQPFGAINTDTLRSGDTYCVRTVTGRDNVSVSYETSFCAEHADTQSSVLMMNQAGTTPEMQMQAAAYAVVLWRSEVEKLYQEICDASDPTAKTVAMTEYVRFLSEVANYEAMLKVLYPDQPALVATKVADLWENKCIDLCYDAHATAAERKDSLLTVMPAAGAVAVNCTCEVTAQEAGKKTSVQSYCAMHSFPFSMIDALLQGNDTAEAWTMVRQIWGVELTNAYNKVYAAMADNKLLAMTEYNALTQWMMAREASLIALYPENPEIVVQIMVKTIMERVNDLCQAIK